MFVSLIFLILSKQHLNFADLSFKSVPIWAYLGGVVGVLVVTLSNYITHKTPAFYLTLLVFTGQLFTVIIIDYFTLNQLFFGKVIGGVLVLVGLTYNLILDQQENEQLHSK